MDQRRDVRVQVVISTEVVMSKVVFIKDVGSLEKVGLLVPIAAVKSCLDDHDW